MDFITIKMGSTYSTCSIISKGKSDPVNDFTVVYFNNYL